MRAGNRAWSRPWGRLADPVAVTTRHSASLYPFQIGSALPTGPAAGPVIGLDVLAGNTVFHYDPWQLYARRVVTSPNMVVLGQLGKGKSSLVKTHLHRQLLSGRQVFVLDPKGEYTPLADLHALPRLRLAPGSPDRLNPLDPHPGERGEQLLRRRSGTVAALAATGLGRDLTPEERAGLTAALADLTRSALLGDVVDGLLHPTPQMALALATTPDRLAAAVRPLALELRRLLTGDLAGLVDAPTSCRLDPTGPGLVLDLSAAFGTPALPAVMVCAGAWLSTALTGQRHPDVGLTGDPGGTGRQRLLLVDEAWALLHLPATTSWLQGLSKLARAHGIQLITVVHRVSDLAGQADTGSATQAQARGLLTDAETRVLYAQSPAERALLAELLGLTGPELELVTALPPHRALWQIGAHTAVVEHVLSRLERDRLIDTDQQMRPPRSGPASSRRPAAVSR
ncbi:MAG: ATP-binding protein [Mycobacteriales bacterium]